MSVEWHSLGEFIEVCNKRNGDLRYGVELIEGVNSSGEFCPPKACTDGIDLKPYKIVQTGDFVYNPSRINIGSLSYRTGAMCIVSHLYVVFHLTEKGKRHLLPEYLWLFFNREEFGRLVAYRNFGSQRPEFNFRQMCEVEVPIPPIAEQRKVVEAWQGLRAVKEQNEQLAAPLLALCRSALEKHKKTFPMKPIGEFIRQIKEKNSDNAITLEQGINIEKEFITPQRSNSDLSSRIIVRTGQIAYCTQLNNANVAVAYRTGPDCVVSPVYNVVEVVEKKQLLDEYLFLCLCRPEFGRYVYWASKGSAYEFLVYDNLCSAKIPIPPLEVQQAVVDLYHCAEEAKKIAAEADAKSREICPALMQWVVKESA